ncbi:hypothetical protein G5I_06071 [Acromyrmex echinatior]|uniref:Uncharacterized protein n=1 Tax=Acromyrmex echinatior TaxID=103372 RepID=F4WK28_ACREC|nr:hypothetical protein G5I_06071 [Acromyrmex echinatior]
MGRKIGPKRTETTEGAWRKRSGKKKILVKEDENQLDTTNRLARISKIFAAFEFVCFLSEERLTGCDKETYPAKYLITPREDQMTYTRPTCNFLSVRYASGWCETLTLNQSARKRTRRRGRKRRRRREEQEIFKLIRPFLLIVMLLNYQNDVKVKLLMKDNIVKLSQFEE